jgi:hypothetical protein
MRKSWAFAAAFLLLASAAWAQDEKKRFNPADRIREFLDPARMKENIERATERIAQAAGERYKLDDGQKEQLKTLMADKMKDFAEKNADTFKQLADDAAALQEKGQDINLGDIAKMFEKVRPLMENARKSMNEAGDAFRDKILDETQKKQFEEDRARGNDAFDRFSRGIAGGGGGFGPGGNTRSFTGRGFEEQSWESYLTRTIRTAKMTDEQQAKAKDMLEQAKKAAADYRKAKETEYKKVAAELAELRKTPDAEKRKAVEKEGEELSAPIDAIGKKFRDDIVALLTDEQKAAVEKSAGRRKNAQPQN